MSIVLSVEWIVAAKSEELVQVLYHWERYDEESIFMVYGQLRIREYKFGNELKVFLHFFCRQHQYRSIDIAFEDFLERKLGY